MRIPRFDKDLMVRIAICNAVLVVCWLQSVLTLDPILLDNIIAGKSIVRAAVDGFVPLYQFASLAPLITHIFLFSDVALRDLSLRGSLLITRALVRQTLARGLVTMMLCECLATVPATLLALLVISLHGFNPSSTILIIAASMLLLISAIAWQSICIVIQRFTNHLNASLMVAMLALMLSVLLTVIGPDELVATLNPMLHAFVAGSAYNGSVSALGINSFGCAGSFLYFVVIAAICQYIAVHQSHKIDYL